MSCPDCRTRTGKHKCTVCGRAFDFDVVDEQSLRAHNAQRHHGPDGHLARLLGGDGGRKRNARVVARPDYEALNAGDEQPAAAGDKATAAAGGGDGGAAASSAGGGGDGGNGGGSPTTVAGEAPGGGRRNGAVTLAAELRPVDEDGKEVVSDASRLRAEKMARDAVPDSLLSTGKHQRKTKQTEGDKLMIEYVSTLDIPLDMHQRD